MKNFREVYFVHSVDTEGPLFESTNATFRRIEELTKIKIKKKSSKVLNQIKNNTYPDRKINKILSKIINPYLMSYNTNWKMIKKMLDKISSKKFRNKIKDSFNNGYKLTWHCVDHVGYEYNPRKRSTGYGKIYKFYKNHIKKYRLKDKIEFHFHPMSIYKEAHRNASLLFRNDNIYQILCRRVIEEKWFPSVNRAGFHIEKPDSHWFLEQYIPFDLSNTHKIEKSSKLKKVQDNGWDWRHAPKNWEIYNPHHDDYRKKGNCRRYIGRILSIMNRTESISLKEIEKAFLRARSGKRTLLAVTSHDFRDMEIEINYIFSLLKKTIKKFPKVKFYFCDAAEAFRKVLDLNQPKNKRIKLKIKKIKKNKIKITSKNAKVFGPQPFLAIKLKNKKKFIHDNLDLGNKPNEWFYTFNNDTTKPETVDTIGVGAADKNGYTDVATLRF